MANHPVDRRVADGCRLTCASRRTFITRIPGIVLAAMAGADAAAAEAIYAVGEMTGIEIDPTHKAFPIPAGDGAAIDKKTGVILVRLQGKVMAFNLSCPHENTALRWKPAVGRFECTKHDSKYSPDGTYIGGRATRNMDRLKIARDGATVVVDLSTMIKSDAQLAEWQAAVISV